MDWHNLMSTMASQASDLELLRLRTALDHLMLQLKRIMAIRQHLHIGQAIEYLDVHTNAMQPGRVIEFKPDQFDDSVNAGLEIPLAAICINPGRTGKHANAAKDRTCASASRRLRSGRHREL